MQQYELTSSSDAPPSTMMQPGALRGEDPGFDVALHKSTLRKLDFLLLPFLALLFLFNSLDKSNIGNAESAHFTRDIGLREGDLNTAVALFFAFFVTLQPVGAALGRRYGMVVWVPSCMLLWGIATGLHVWVRERWQLYTLRIAIGCLEAGFYPVTVSYLSLFYTRFEFGRRLSLFYGQAAVGGALGGVISYFVFSRFPDNSGALGDEDAEQDTRWRSWQVLFMLEGSLTVIVAIIGYFWLPHSAATAWFLTPAEREYATQRIIQDLSIQSKPTEHTQEPPDDELDFSSSESHGLLNPSKSPNTVPPSATDDRGLTPHDIISALFNPRIWHILACNILSAIPVYAFQVFLPLVLAPLTSTPNPALVNLLTAPPYFCGAVTLYLFASYSDRHRQRLMPILAGLALVLGGLTLVVLLPTIHAWVVPRYVALNVLLAGTFIASPLTVAWISGNTPSAGKRAVLLGINGWGNLAGVFSALLFQPKYKESGYIVPFGWTLVCVGASAVGYVLFYRGLIRENEKRKRVVERGDGEMDGGGEEYLVLRVLMMGLERVRWGKGMTRWLEGAVEAGREGDEKMTFVYGL